MAGNKDPNNVWEYNPSKGAAILFTILWLITSTYHFVQMIQHRKWYCWVLVMGCTWEFVGFALRILSIDNPTSVALFAPQLTFIVLAPIWIAAFDYMSLGRLINVFLPSKRCLGLSARRITLLFVGGDIFSFIVQLSGSMFLTGNNPSPHDFKLGTNILIGGQCLQLLLFSIFIVMSIRFEINYKAEFGNVGKERWVAFMRVLNVSCVCICIRSIFRIAEFASTYPGPLVTHEVAFYVLDAVMMLFAVWGFHLVHPGKVLVGEESSFRAERKRRKMQERDTSTSAVELSSV
ncbi:RTA1-domain-containing protein [Wilcoxina mikolae CBS 423.85]|nr:RTA1-domain-containing protein [Wilcoxina mikolae CBS 423.85]